MQQSFSKLGKFALSVALVGTAGAMTLSAQAQDDAAVPSNTEGSLPSPQTWDCDRIRPEYRAWLDDGNSPESWKYVGPTYRDVADDRLYDWNDWLEWNRANCAAVVGEAKLMSDRELLIGGIVGAMAVTAIAAGSGGSSGGGSGGNDSPG